MIVIAVENHHLEPLAVKVFGKIQAGEAASYYENPVLGHDNLDYIFDKEKPETFPIILTSAPPL